MSPINPTAVLWRKSSYSGGNGGECVEVVMLRSDSPGHA
ncbi:DUF397 domain-containing protein [Actinoallomurus sp. NPDC052308]